jgi:hypothetical protein
MKIESLIKKLASLGHYTEALSLNQMLNKMAKKEDSCPKATQDLDLNLKNRQKGIDKYLYGPMNPKLDNKKGEENNDSFWGKVAKVWSGKSKVEVTIKQAKTMRCSNCAAFDTSPQMKKCIAEGIEGEEKGEHPFDTVNAGTLGYCKFLNFKCAAKRTCKAWVAKD